MLPGNKLRDNVFMTPLNRCPWCQERILCEEQSGHGWYIGCVNDECDIKPSYWGDSESEVIKVWNSAKISKTGSQDPKITVWNPPSDQK